MLVALERIRAQLAKCKTMNTTIKDPPKRERQKREREKKKKWKLLWLLA